MTSIAFPRLRPDVRLVEQVLGGERSAVVKDPVTGKYFRLPPTEVRVLRAFDGGRGVRAELRAHGDPRAHVRREHDDGAGAAARGAPAAEVALPRGADADALELRRRRSRDHAHDALGALVLRARVRRGERRVVR